MLPATVPGAFDDANSARRKLVRRADDEAAAALNRTWPPKGLPSSKRAVKPVNARYERALIIATL